ncbi:hypothetical protein DL89DRAFT_124004 [Linderina pennispora]|uniref:ARMC9 CTLH-like domain-containing protein n=1 Tax=Linderina pennispora TaxID=61395 RepID=A0A1Y1WDD6_9FUNG|nr:uncharacterized protein DL89DRAFT_124004 [Linderina pennispora]ORX71348.1 hypothetical protein DL89DRAFT_124004 [Linderina pennispora]
MMFRGFNGTLQAFEDDLKRDQDKGFKPDSVVDELLTMATELKISPLLEYWQYLTFRFFSHLSPKYQRTTRMFEKRLIRLFLVSAVRKDQRPEIRKYFDEYGVILGQQGDWVPWLGLEYVQDPASRPEFEAYFSDDWYDSLRTALRDFMQTVFPAMAVPRIMLYEKERREKERLEARVKQLEEHFAGETKIKTTGVLGSRSGGLVENHIKSLATSVKSPKSAAATLANKGVAAKGKVADVGAEEVGVLASSNSLCVPSCDPGSYSPSVDLGIGVIQANEPASLLKISQEDIFLEHNSPVTLAKFSPSGEVIASYDEDMMLKVWSPDPESVAPKLKNRLGYPVNAMAWDNKYTHLLYLYDDEGYIHTLNTNTNLMSRQLAKEKRHPYIISMLSSPTSSSLLTLSSTSARNASGRVPATLGRQC